MAAYGLRSFLKIVVFSIVLALGVSNASAQDDPIARIASDLPTDPQELADLIGGEITAIRGLEFKEKISVQNQSLEDFETYLDAELGREFPPDRARNIGKVVKQLGLYRGPEIEDMAEMVKFLMKSQAAAYYDPEQSTFFVLMGDLPPLLLATSYAHELHHGLQDQYWDLNAYLLEADRDGLNDDAILARQAVVEGEASYIMTLWMMKKLTGRDPQGPALDLAIQMQSQMDVAALRGMLRGGAVSAVLGENMQEALVALGEIPAFMIETLIGAYLKGMAFTHHIVKEGWDNARYYTDPPTSTEQILHPEKWLEGDDPVLIEFPAIDSEELLDGWEPLDTNVIGELQWRIIFAEHDMADRAASIAAGWDGDRYTVLERADELLLLLYTTWDSEREAAEFAEAYAELLTVKYEGIQAPTAVDVRGTDVLIVEGGDLTRMADYLAFLARSTESG